MKNVARTTIFVAIAMIATAINLKSAAADVQTPVGKEVIRCIINSSGTPYVARILKARWGRFEAVVSVNGNSLCQETFWGSSAQIAIPKSNPPPQDWPAARYVGSSGCGVVVALPFSNVPSVAEGLLGDIYVNRHQVQGAQCTMDWYGSWFNGRHSGGGD